MKTIKLILGQNKTSMEELRSYELMGICNGCGGKGGYNISEKVSKYKNYLSIKNIRLLDDLKVVCNIHDKDFYFGVNFEDFIFANITLANNTILLLHWTGILRKLFVWFMVFIIPTLFGYKYFKDKTIFTEKEKQELIKDLQDKY